MKPLHPTFGVLLDFKDLESPEQINELVKQYKLVMLDQVPFAEDRHAISNFVLQLGKPLNAVPIYSKIGGHFEWEPGLPWMDIHYTHGVRTDLQIHQDGFWYGQQKRLTSATVCLKDYQEGEVAGDTIFYNSQAAYEKFDPEFQEYLKTLLISHIHNRHDVAGRNRRIERLRKKYLGIPERFKRFHRLVKLRDSRFEPGDFDVNWLVQTDDYGTWLHYSSQGNVEFINVSKEESDRIRDILTPAIETEPYYHTWSRFQLGFWENKRIVHGRADNNIGDRERPMWRIQYTPYTPC